MPTPYRHRTLQLRHLIREAAIDALLVTSPFDWYYLTGFTGEAGALIVSGNRTTLVTDGRFTVQAKEELSNVAIVLQKDGLYRTCGELLRKHRQRRVGFDADHLTVAQQAMLKKSAGSSVKLQPVRGLVQGLRAIKDSAELAQMRKAAVLADQVVQGAIKLLKPGVRELEVAAEIEYRMRRLGASGPAFESIVAFGERAALPHARPTAKRLKKGDLVVLDLGAILGKYCSDITRTVFVGKASAKIRTWYSAVLEAQAAAIDAVGAGRTCGEVDAAARGVLAAYHLDQYFVHSTGHGLGLEVHEDPRLAKGQKTLLASGNVVTIEPGVYVPGVGGIRIEDDVAVLRRGNEVLTRAPREFIEL
ncbi:MAG TPA: Xaa-Pro peptidase family protein [Candidatus Acidoferrum sp.]|nr:Xaa-Pro peptidase family protein [Candidatus Acidoferrum sp.]